MNYREGVVWISPGEGLGKAGGCPGIPLDFIRMKHTIHLFNIVNLLLILRSPKIIIHPYIFVVNKFLPLTYNEIFPQATNITSKFRLGKICNQCIPDSVVIEVYFSSFFQLFSQIPAEGSQTKNDECLFQELYVFFNDLDLNCKNNVFFCDYNQILPKFKQCTQFMPDS